ncbi:MAG TPA: hypothetical protein VK790_02250 [Solirubrobacteraceae bacterium]|jgi:hypothetical protein|nr:hypothetical protein [Solirubrobacteraceae bacterium]
MTQMKRRISIALAASIALALALPALAPATLTEVGVIGTTTPATAASCPATPCLAVSRTTGFQVKVGSERNVLSAPRAGTIVAWTITLGNPTAAQIKFFDENEGGPAEAGIAILQPQRKPNLTYKLIAQGPLVKLQPYFGKTAQFPLETTIPIKKGYVVALTVPSWAPALALGFGNDTSWRASRPKSGCKTTSAQTTQTTVGSAVQYFCLYQTARLTYSATLISTP